MERMIKNAIKNAVMESLMCDIDVANYGMRSAKRLSDYSFGILMNNKIWIHKDKVFKDGIEVATIERRYSSRKTCGNYKELKPKVTWLQFSKTPNSLATVGSTIINFIKFKIMKKFNLSVKQCKMIEKSIRYTISDLQRNNFLQTQHHLSGHACDYEIRQLKELQKIFF